MLPILVGDQGPDYTPLMRYCEAWRVPYRQIEYDIGLSAARNHLVRCIDTDYFLLAEDDMIVEEALDVGFCERFLDAHPAFAVVTGHLYDYDSYKAEDRLRRKPRELNLVIDESGSGLILIPIEMFGTAQISFEGRNLAVCDYGPNWGLFRRRCFLENDLWWDEAFKIGGQHIDFFLRLKLHGGAGVASYRGLACDHISVKEPRYDALRDRDDWIEHFRRKWGFRYMYKMGEAVRYFDDYLNAVTPNTRASRELERLRNAVAKRDALIAKRNDMLARKDEAIAILKGRFQSANGRKTS
jgi:hypothetical protein